MDLKLINLMPHDFTYRSSDGIDHVIPASDTIARLEVKQVVVGEVNGMPVVKTEYGNIVGFPEEYQEEGIGYIVSTLVGNRFSDIRGYYGYRTDIFGPDTGPTAIRNEKNQIIAVQRLVQF